MGCRAFYPHGRSLVERHKDKPFVVLGINSGDEKELIRKVVKDEKLTWRFWVDGDSGPIIRKWNVRAFPTTYVLDHKGVIRYKNVHGEEMDRAIDKLLAEAEKKQ